MGTGALLSMTTGAAGNTAVGYDALVNNTIGYGNTAIGYASLNYNTTARYNTAFGEAALFLNTTGNNNTATGVYALYSNSTGNENVASGQGALVFNTTGSYNTATGDSALAYNAEGNYNTANGYLALTASYGSNNTASGAFALYANTSGYDNTASGTDSLSGNTTGYLNTATGIAALYSNTQGIRNTAVGHAALFSNTLGSGNVGLGDDAGYQVTTGNNNIEIANDGAATDNGTIRIGTQGKQNATYIAGIENAQVTGAVVYVTSSGQLGVLASSERYKTDVAAIGANTEKLRQLRPVTFHLKSDPSETRQYGLIAEEVNKVYPELVIRDDAGNIQGVRYDELAPMLLNELQKQQATIKAQADKADAQAVEFRAMQEQLAELKQMNDSMRAALLKLQAKD